MRRKPFQKSFFLNRKSNLENGKLDGAERKVFNSSEILKSQRKYPTAKINREKVKIRILSRKIFVETYWREKQALIFGYTLINYIAHNMNWIVIRCRRLGKPIGPKRMLLNCSVKIVCFDFNHCTSFGQSLVTNSRVRN